MIKMSYDEILAIFKELERKLKDLPEISLMGDQYFPLMISRPICIAKELLKWAITSIETGDKNQLRWLVDNIHILEEMNLLKKDMDNLGKNLEIARVRVEPLQFSFSVVDVERWERKWKEH